MIKHKNEFIENNKRLLSFLIYKLTMRIFFTQILKLIIITRATVIRIKDKDFLRTIS